MSITAQSILFILSIAAFACTCYLFRQTIKISSQMNLVFSLFGLGAFMTMLFALCKFYRFGNKEKLNQAVEYEFKHHRDMLRHAEMLLATIHQITTAEQYNAMLHLFRHFRKIYKNADGYTDQKKIIKQVLETKGRQVRRSYLMRFYEVSYPVAE